MALTKINLGESVYLERKLTLDLIIATIQVKAMNKYEKFTHWYWNRKPHCVTCSICRKTLRSNETDISPEEYGWKCTKDGWNWICHRCLNHRDFKPYIRQTDIDELNEYMRLGYIDLKTYDEAIKDLDK